jgi:hypothetical protein
VVQNAEIGILHSLYNQAPKKVILYEKQYILEQYHRQGTGHRLLNAAESDIALIVAA